MSVPVQFAPVMLAEDRSLAVPPGQVIQTGYVSVWKCRLACRERMAFGDVKGAFEKRLQLGDHQPWPCPRGYWQDGEFVIVDGRHEYVAAVMLGVDYLLVAWASNPAADNDRVVGRVAHQENEPAL